LHHFFSIDSIYDGCIEKTKNMVFFHFLKNS